MNDEFALPGVDEAADLKRVESTQVDGTIDDGTATPETEPQAMRPPGPGLPESLLWTLGLFIVMLLAAIVWTLLFIAYRTVQGHQFNPVADTDALMMGMSVNARIMMLLPPSLLAFVVMIPLGLLRLGPRRLGKLNLSPPSFTQLVIVLAAVFPTTIVSTPMFVLANDAWTSFCEGIPALEAFNEQSSVMMMVEQYFRNGSLALLLFFLAVVPAVGEEFVFRGVIGRGLTARWGIFAGVLITSCLFAFVHLYPPHIVAVLPIGIMMHLVYLATRSLWAPVLFHFSNNALAATFVSLGAVTEDEPALWMPFAALAYLAVTLVLLYYYRTRYVNDEGEQIGPGYLTVEEPPPEAGAQRVAPNGWIVASLMTLLVVGTAMYIGIDLARSIPAPHEDGEAETVHLDDLRPSQLEPTGFRHFDGTRELQRSTPPGSERRIKV